MANGHAHQLQQTRAFLKAFLRTDPFRLYGAHAVGVGRKETGGKATDQIAVRVYVAHKVPRSSLPASRRVPSQIAWRPPDSADEVPILTDVIESPPGHVLMPDPESRLRPVPGGVSGSAAYNGTLGGWVWDVLDESIVMLSNAHVIGYDAGVPILQPGANDGGQPGADRIGEVKRAVAVSPVVGPSPWPVEQCNFVDAAIGSADSSDLFDLTVLEVGPAVYDTQLAALGMTVEKMGQTTGLTVGTVVDIDYAAAYNTPLGPSPSDWEIVAYCDLIRFEPTQPGTQVTLSGDSGSLLFTPDPDSVINPVLGLVAWGDTVGGTYGVACKIQNVFEELRVDVLCAGGFGAFLDALAEDGQDVEAAVAMSLFEPARPRPGRTRRLHDGLARDVQRRLRDSETGREIVAFVDRHRAELLSLLLKEGDVRRSVVSALRPILRGATTTDRVFAHTLADDTLDRIELSFDATLKHGSKALEDDLRALRKRLDLRQHRDEPIRSVVGG